MKEFKLDEQDKLMFKLGKELIVHLEEIRNL